MYVYSLSIHIYIHTYISLSLYIYIYICVKPVKRRLARRPRGGAGGRQGSAGVRATLDVLQNIILHYMYTYIILCYNILCYTTV